MFMFMVSHDASSIEVAWARTVGAAPRPWLVAPVLAAGVLVGVYEAHLALGSPGAVLRGDLARSGKEVADLAWSTPAERVRQSVARDFPGYRATVDASHFPAYVSVTLHDLDRATCRAAHRSADRIEGNVMIAMRSLETVCEPGASVTWRIMR